MSVSFLDQFAPEPGPFEQLAPGCPALTAEEVARHFALRNTMLKAEADLAKALALPASKPASPWYPPQQEGFGPWVEGLPPDSDAACHIMSAFERDERNWHVFGAIYAGSTWRKQDRRSDDAIVAHCVKVDQPTKPAEKPADPIPNIDMLNRDLRPLTERERLHAESKRIEDADWRDLLGDEAPPDGITTVAPLSRIGGQRWGL